MSTLPIRVQRASSAPPLTPGHSFVGCCSSDLVAVWACWCCCSGCSWSRPNARRVPETPWTEPISGLNFCPPAEVGFWMPVAGSWPSHARCGRFGCPTRCWVTVDLERWRVNGSASPASGRSLGGLFPRRCVINGWKRWFQVSNDGGKICFAGWPRRMGDQSRSCTRGPRRLRPKLSVHRLLLCGDSVPNTRNSSERHRQDGLQDRFVSGHCPTRCCRPTKSRICF